MMRHNQRRENFCPRKLSGLTLSDTVQPKDGKLWSGEVSGLTLLGKTRRKENYAQMK